MADLTGHPYLPADRATADAMAALPGIREAVYDATLDDPADIAARPVAELARWTQQADAARDQTRYAVAAHDLGTLLTELHIAAATGHGDDRRTALGALVQACHVAGAVAEVMGNQDLALACAAREHEVASRLGDPTLLGLARYGWAQTWARVGARRRAAAIVGESLADLDSADPSAVDTGPAEMLGMGHLFAAKLAARTGHRDDAARHLDHAAGLAARTGEHNTAWQHFGPTNVALWRVAVDTDLGGARRSTSAPCVMRPTSTCWAASIGRPTSTSTWPARWCPARGTGMPRRSGTWTPPTGWPHSASGPIRSSGSWSVSSTAVRGAACGSQPPQPVRYRVTPLLVIARGDGGAVAAARLRNAPDVVR